LESSVRIERLEAEGRRRATIHTTGTTRSMEEVEVINFVLIK
jgi:hypothetical protein